MITKIAAKNLKPGMIVRARVSGQEYYVVSVDSDPPVVQIRWVPIERMQYTAAHEQTEFEVTRK